MLSDLLLDCPELHSTLVVHWPKIVDAEISQSSLLPVFQGRKIMFKDKRFETKHNVKIQIWNNMKEQL